jgi:O-Antigen ligase
MSTAHEVMVDLKCRESRLIQGVAKHSRFAVSYSTIWVLLCLTLPIESSFQRGKMIALVLIISLGIVVFPLFIGAISRAVAMVFICLVGALPFLPRLTLFIILSACAAFVAGCVLGCGGISWVVGIVAAVDLVLAIAENRLGRPLWASILGTDLRRILGADQRAAGVTGHPLVSSCLLVFFVVTIWFAGQGTRGRGLAFASLLCLMAAALLHGSKSALVVPFLVVSMDSLFRKNGHLSRRASLALALAGSLGLLVLVGVHLPGRLAAISDLSTSDSFTERSAGLRIWSNLLSGDATKLILGRGYGASSKLLSQSQVGTNGYSTTDNAFLTAIYDSGFLGLAILMTPLAMAVKSLRKGRNSDTLPLALGVICLSCYGLLFEIQYWTSTRVLLSACCGALYVSHFSDSSGSRLK